MSRSVKNSQPLDPQGFRFTGVRPQTEQPWPLAVASETKTISARPGLAGLAMKIPSGPLLPLLLVSLVGWLLLLTAHGNPMILPAICGVSSSRILAGVWPAIESVLLVTPATQLLLAWMLMLAAMMPPLLARPMERLWFAGTAGRRSSATALFLLAYFGVWTLAGVVLMATAVAVEVLANGARLSALVPAGLVAFIWQATPLKQVALNACHRPPRMTPDGLVAVRDSPRYGLPSRFHASAHAGLSCSCRSSFTDHTASRRWRSAPLFFCSSVGVRPGQRGGACPWPRPSGLPVGLQRPLSMSRTTCC